MNKVYMCVNIGTFNGVYAAYIGTIGGVALIVGMLLINREYGNI